MKLENESTKNYAITKEKLLQQEIDMLRTDLDSKSAETQKRLIEIN